MPITNIGKVIVTRNPRITAYEIAVANGFVGTEAEWLASLTPAPAYKVYKALITDNTDPGVTVHEVIENNFIDAPIWTSDGSGTINVASADIIDNGKVDAFIMPYINSDDVLVLTFPKKGDGVINFTSSNYQTSVVQGNLLKLAIVTIMVYP